MGGCSFGDEPEPGTGATTSAAPTASEPKTTEPTESPEPEPTETGPTPPPRPAAMDDTGKKGAQAAAEYFIALTTYASMTGETTELAAMSNDSTCGFCVAVVEEAEEYETSGYTVTGGATEISNLQTGDKDSLTGGYAVTTAFSADERKVHDASGTEVNSWDRDTGFLQIDLVHDGSSWRTLALTTDQGEAG
ncbi:DUF6318 family protein [Paraoerskovia marina]|uniref:DUF6318 family protein n=1 Tax=Paraoerskovia marina TaxID=545619 RepID=UPI0024A89EC6|nr:DUF6318 family protein [Paraoerskovia marina]